MAEVTVLEYQTASGRRPYSEWAASIGDKSARAAVLTRVDRLGLGNLGDWKAVGEGVGELRIHFGPGYRIYFARDGATIVVLLCGGSKRSQASDIKQAKLNWKDYEARKAASAGRTAR